ncbi:MAG: twin-arginine translocation signal domain-containing protein [Planctomycetota bacterium]
MKRRTFLKAVGSIATGGALGVQSVLGGSEQATSTGTIEKGISGTGTCPL